MEIAVYLGVVGLFVGIMSAILAFFLPFMVYFMLQHVKAIRTAAQATERRIANIEKNVYLAVTK